MLTITRREGEKVLIGNQIEILVREIRGGQVRLSIVAPRGMPVIREELFEMIADQNRKAARTPAVDALELLADRLRVDARNPGVRRVVLRRRC